MLLTSLFFACIFPKWIACSYCDLHGCPQVDFEKHNGDEIWTWLESQKNRQAVTFCPSDGKLASSATDNVKPISEPYDCSPSGSLIVFQGSLKNGLPSGKGRLVALFNPVPVENDEKCLEILPVIKSIYGNFKKGLPHGKGTIEYEDDGTFLEGNFVNGVLNGKVKVFSKENYLISVGQYQGGLAHGPFWIHSRFFGEYLFLNFKHGLIEDSSIYYLKESTKEVFQGTLVNGTFMANSSLVQIDGIGELNCIKMIKTSKIKDVEDPFMRLPVRLFPSIKDQRIFVRPNKVLYFNRVAKTGSQSIARLLFELGKVHGFILDVKVMLHSEHICDSHNPAGKFNEIDYVLKWNSPVAIVKHYSYLDFASHGYDWTPDWFSIVRDPVDKVISWFYYVRAPWRNEELAKVDKSHEMPSEEYLNKNFEDCVLNGDHECLYMDGQDVEDEPGDHRSQIVQFCGHEPFCRLFNNPDALQLAKENVEKHYKVVGITEDMNKTLTVAAHYMPEYFKGALEIYHQEDIVKYRYENKGKPKISQHVKNLVRANFTLEVEFYEFLKQRLDLQYEKIK